MPVILRQFECRLNRVITMLELREELERLVETYAGALDSVIWFEGHDVLSAEEPLPDGVTEEWHFTPLRVYFFHLFVDHVCPLPSPMNRVIWTRFYRTLRTCESRVLERVRFDIVTLDITIDDPHAPNFPQPSLN